MFRGVRGEFKDLVTSLVARADPLPYADLLIHLLTHEFIHKSSHFSMGSAVIHAPLLPMPNILPSALLSHRQPSAQFGRNRGRSYGSWRPQQNLHRGSRNSGSRPDFRSFHSTHSNDNRHISWKGNWQCNRGSNSRCQLCQTFGHTAPQCSQLQQRGYGQQHSANLALHNSAGTADWFPDTDANQHVTPDLATLTTSEPYNGNDNLHVGDGKGLSITHIGHTKIYNPHRSFTLSNVLHVLAITKLFRNFISIIMFILSFTIFCFMSRISTPMKYSSQDRVKMVSTLCPCSGLPSRQFLKPIVIKPGPGVDLAKGPGPGFQGSTRVNSGQAGLTLKN